MFRQCSLSHFLWKELCQCLHYYFRIGEARNGVILLPLELHF